jgi:hypothetical protein
LPLSLRRASLLHRDDGSRTASRNTRRRIDGDRFEHGDTVHDCADPSPHRRRQGAAAADAALEAMRTSRRRHGASRAQLQSAWLSHCIKPARSVLPHRRAHRPAAARGGAEIPRACGDNAATTSTKGSP